MKGFLLGETPVASTELAKLTVEAVDNHIYFYSGVDTDRCLALIKSLRQIDGQLRTERISRALPEDETICPIWLHIQSPGGGLHAAFAVADQISQLGTPVWSVVEGYAASAATILSCACDRRFIQPSAFMMVHQLSNVFWGKYEEFKDEQRLMDMAMSELVRFYSARTKMTARKVQAMLARDTWMSADEAVRFGFADALMTATGRRIAK